MGTFKSSVIEAIDRQVGPTLIDMLLAGVPPLDPAVLRTELLGTHHVRKRRFITHMLPKGAVGAELGVFTGLFAAVLLDAARPRTMYFVDPWWKAYGPFYPDWGTYNDHGRLQTAAAHRAAVQRIRKHARSAETHLCVDYSTDFLAGLPDHHLDWVYLDSSHTYEGTRDELLLLRTKLKKGGILIGDDWYDDPEHVHAGVARAVKEALARHDFELIGAFQASQWAVRTPV